tara:strand:- start:727 stop:1680 length:954 start_codon:yes stop_codon:yes gene_type:complete
MESMKKTTPQKPAKAPLRDLLDAKTFVVTAETSPPVSIDGNLVLEKIAPLAGYADAINITDGAGAKSHMASLVTANFLVDAGFQPIVQMTVRDRNRLALQNDLLGAGALGAHNILCLTGDHVSTGDQPDAKMVMDLDSCSLMEIARTMRDKGILPSGRSLTGPAPQFLIGAADAPREPSDGWSPEAIRAKILAGASFFQTQFCFNIDLVKRYIERLGSEGFLEQATFLIGIGPIASAKSAIWMNKNLYGVEIPDNIIKRIESSKDQKAEGRQICAEMLEQLSTIKGVGGAHLMGPNSEQAVAEVIQASGVLELRAVA